MNDAQVVDVNGVRNVVARYVHFADDGDGSGVASLFVSDGTMNSLGVTVRGREALGALIERIAPACLKHITANSAVEVAGNAATATTDVLLLAPGPGRGSAEGWQIMGCGRYDDELVKQDGVWLFQRRTINWHRSTTESTLAAVVEMLS